MKRFKEGIRIYNLFPRLIGEVSRWPHFFEHAKKLGFNWIYINPFHYPGFSGSLYAPKDFYEFNPLFLANSGKSWQEQLKGAVKAAEKLDLKLMMDLVVNHTASDSILTKTNPKWYKRDKNGKLVHPHCVDPADTRKITIWGDLAEIDNENSEDKEGLWQYWENLVDFYIETGFLGFRCDAAYQVPVALWERLINHAKKKNENSLFLAETLGCEEKDIVNLSGCGFDYIYNSSKWWNFSDDWCLRQYNLSREHAPSVSFPETHDTERLSNETSGNQQVSKKRYLFSMFFSTGLMMPIGFEYGFKKKCDVVKTMPHDWEEKTFDISEFIAKVNRLKAKHKIFNEENFLESLNSRNDAVLLLKKTSLDEKESAIIIFNNDDHNPQNICIASILGILGNGSLADISLENKMEISEAPFEINLNPSEVKIILRTS